MMIGEKLSRIIIEKDKKPEKLDQQRQVIREILMQVKQDDGGFDFTRFKVLYSSKYINEDLKF